MSDGLRQNERVIMAHLPIVKPGDRLVTGAILQIDKLLSHFGAETQREVIHSGGTLNEGEPTVRIGTCCRSWRRSWFDGIKVFFRFRIAAVANLLYYRISLIGS
jgi:hypothetical protein